MSKFYIAQQQKWLDDYHRSARSAIAALIAGCGIYLVGGYSNIPLVRSTCCLLATISAYSVIQVRWITRNNQQILDASRDVSAQATVDNLFLGMHPGEPMDKSSVNVEDVPVFPLSRDHDN